MLLRPVLIITTLIVGIAGTARAEDFWGHKLLDQPTQFIFGYGSRPVILPPPSRSLPFQCGSPRSSAISVPGTTALRPASLRWDCVDLGRTRMR